MVKSKKKGNRDGVDAPSVVEQPSVLDPPHDLISGVGEARSGQVLPLNNISHCIWLVDGASNRVDPCAGPPILNARLVLDAISHIQQDSWGDARILLTPEAIYAAHLYANQPVLVRTFAVHGACGGIPEKIVSEDGIV